jgi:hypothetical protein
MPRIKDVFTDCAVYVYGSLGDAKNGEKQGGSGFMVAVPLEKAPDHHWTYIITNRHVIVRAKQPVIRLNRKDGTTECFETQSSDWYMHSDGDDVAILPFHFDAREMRYAPVPIGAFLTKQLVTDEDVGIGDDTFMVGRFINHEGKQRNTPSVRFGNIAMMPEPITSPYGLDQESFLVEARSLPGYSGSAVFLYSPCAMNDMSVRRLGHEKSSIAFNPLNLTPQGQADLQRNVKIAFASKGPYLLGIDWCHIESVSPVREKNGDPMNDGWTVRANTGMAGVIPAWKIQEALNSEELRTARENNERSFLENRSDVPD